MTVLGDGGGGQGQVIDSNVEQRQTMTAAGRGNDRRRWRHGNVERQQTMTLLS